MYRFAVIDDEDMIRQGIPLLFNWEQEGFALAGTAGDGLEGLQLLLDEQPDLALVDIRMPGLDGLELIREARKSGFKGHIIILTAYSQFDYAKKAIKEGVDAYLLKPIDEEELLEILAEIRGKLDARQSLSSTFSEFERLRITEALRASLLKNPLPDSASKDELERYFEEQGGRAFVLLVKDSLTKPGDPRREFKQKVESRRLLDSEKQLSFMLDGHFVQIIFSNEEERLRERLENDLALKPWDEGFPVALGFEVTAWENLCYSYETAKFLLDRSFLFEPDELISYTMLYDVKQGFEALNADKVTELLRFGEKEDVLNFVAGLAVNARKALLEEYHLKQLLLDLVKTLGEERAYPADSCRRAEEALRGASSLELCCSALHRTLAEWQEYEQKRAETDGSGGSAAMQKCLFYIRNYYADNISLDSCAKRYHYNANYLGRVFRRERGRSFAKELENTRLDAAAELLAASEEAKVYEVARQVGFGNMDAFYAKFRERFNKTPKNYQMYINEG